MMPLPNRPLSATAFRIQGETFLFDAGEGTQVSWRSSGWNFRPTGTILLSHLHADHIGGLPGILFQLAYSGREDPVTIYGPPLTYQVISALITIVGTLPYELRIVELENDQQIELPGGAYCSTMALDHRAPCIGYAITLPRRPGFDPEKARRLNVPQHLWKPLQEGHPADGFRPEDVTGPPRRGLKLSLVTDTRYKEDIAAFVQGSDLLVCESMYAEDADAERAWERGHLTIRQATRIASDGDVRRLWLTHFSPKVQCPSSYLGIARQWFENTDIGETGMKTTLQFDE